MSTTIGGLRHLIFDHVTDAVAVLRAQEPDFAIIEANQACRALQAQPTRPLVGQPWDALLPPSDTHDLPAIFGKVIATGEPFQAHDFPVRRGGTSDGPAANELRYWDWRCFPLPAALGGIDRLLVIIVDVTERRRQRRGRLLNRQIVAQAPLGVLVTSGPDHRTLLVSPRLAQLSEQPPARLIGHPALDALPALAEAGLAPLLAEVYTSGLARTFEEFSLYTAARHETAVWNLTILPLPGLDGSTEGLMLMAADLTAQVRARQEATTLAAAAQRRARELEAVIGAIADGVCLLDSTGRLVEINDAGLRLLGLAPAAEGQRLLEILVGLEMQWEDGRPLHTGDALLQGAFGGQQRATDLVLVGTFAPGRQRRFFSLTATPVAGDDGETSGAVILLREITAQKQAEHEKDAFLSLIAHEVKSPLTAIKGFAQLARRAAGEHNDRIVRHLQVIDQQAARIGSMVDELSEVNRLQQGTLRIDPVHCDLAALVHATVQQQRVALATHPIIFTGPEQPVPIHADPRRVEQVIVNLLVNAAKYSPTGTTIDVTVTRAGRSVRLAVRDHGIGIPASELGRIFDRFYRASNSASSGQGGLGLGLFISREIISYSGGTIWAESTLGEGSTINVSLPLAENDES